MTNRDVHDIAALAYKRFTGKRTGYSVRWETGEWRFLHPEHDCAGYMSKRDAVRLAELLVREGRMGVRVWRTTGIDRPVRSFDDDGQVFSPDSPSLYEVAHSALANEIETMRENGEPQDFIVAQQRSYDNAAIYATDAKLPVDVLKGYILKALTANKAHDELTKAYVPPYSNVSN